MEDMSGMDKDMVWNGAGRRGCMEAVAGLLHVELREVFAIEGVAEALFFLAEDGLYAMAVQADLLGTLSAEELEAARAAAVLDKGCLADLLSGAARIHMEPFVPVEPDFYYYMADDNTVRGCIWHGSFAVCAHAAAGNCFRSEAEALRYQPQLMEQLKARYRASRGLAAPEEAGPADELSLFDELPHD